MSNGIKVSIAKIMIAIAPATRREPGQLRNAKVEEVRLITVVLSFACPEVSLGSPAARPLMPADRLSSGIMPWDEWYHAMALAKLDLGGGRRSRGDRFRDTVTALPRPKRWTN